MGFRSGSFNGRSASNGLSIELKPARERVTESSLRRRSKHRVINLQAASDGFSSAAALVLADNNIRSGLVDLARRKYLSNPEQNVDDALQHACVAFLRKRPIIDAGKVPGYLLQVCPQPPHGPAPREAA